MKNAGNYLGSPPVAINYWSVVLVEPFSHRLCHGPLRGTSYSVATHRPPGNEDTTAHVRAAQAFL